MPLSFSIDSGIAVNPSLVYGQTNDSLDDETEVAPTVTTNTGTARDAFKAAGAGCSVLGSLNPFRTAIICYSNFWLFVASEILIISAYVFDILLLIAISSEFLRLDIINDLWTSIKDVANLGFILALVWISFSLILGTGMNNVRKLLVRVILVALLMNFSLFVARVIIDAGNLTAATFYNSIEAPEIKNSRAGVIDYLLPKSAENALDNSRKSSISGAVVGAVNPARILGEENFRIMVEEQTGGPLSLDFMLAFSMMGVALISILMAKELIVGGFFFLSRIVWLMLLMVVSPLAFVAWFMPGGEKHFKAWFSTIIERSFCLIPYLFALWMVLLVNQAARGDHTAFTASGDQTNIYLIVVLQFAIMYMVMKIARQKSQKMCEGGMGLGNTALKAANFGTGALMGAVTGGAGLAARATVGRGAFNTISGGNRLGQALAQKAADGNFGAQVARRAMGVMADQKIGTSGGYKQRQDKTADARYAEANELENINKKRLTKEYEVKFKSAKDADGNSLYKTEEEARRAASRKAEGEARDSADAFLRRRFVNGEEETLTKGEKPKTGIIAKMGRGADFLAAGATGASQEAYTRRQATVKADKDKKARQADIRREQEERAFAANGQITENKRASVDSAKTNMQALTSKDPDFVPKPEEVVANEAFVQNIESSFKKRFLTRTINQFLHLHLRKISKSTNSLLQKQMKIFAHWQMKLLLRLLHKGVLSLRFLRDLKVLRKSVQRKTKTRLYLKIS